MHMRAYARLHNIHVSRSMGQTLGDVSGRLRCLTNKINFCQEIRVLRSVFKDTISYIALLIVFAGHVTKCYC